MRLTLTRPLLLLALLESSAAITLSPAVLPLRAVAASPLARHPAVTSVHQQVSQEVLVHRSSLAGVHVHAANMLISAVLSVWARLTGATAARIRVNSAPQRSTEPVFLGDSLCERVRDEESGHEFWVCTCNVDDEAYRCRKTAKGGAWVWFCSKV